MTGAGTRYGAAHQGHYAGALSRLLAYGADLLCLSTAYVVALALVQFAINTATPWQVEFKNGYQLVLVGEFLWAAVYFGSAWVGFGRSPGMSLLGLRIVRSDGATLDRRHALIRLVAFPLGFLTLGAGFLGIIFGRTHRAIYDRIADTAVVYDWDAEAAKLRDLASRGARRREASVQAPAEP
ncbi:MAG TPA: RDD family protein [Solirubrobacteraceae bacterium]|nr:RDD family protein [Solirubrobacteraceae bacterium]